MVLKKRGLIIIVLLLIIVFGGYKFMEKQTVDNYVEKQIPRIEKFLKYNYNNIESVTITGTKTNPMGGFFINGYINNDENLTIYAEGSVGTDIEYVSGIPGDFYDKNKKEELGGKSKSVSEIEEEERNSLSFDEKMKLLEKKKNS